MQFRERANALRGTFTASRTIPPLYLDYKSKVFDAANYARVTSAFLVKMIINKEIPMGPAELSARLGTYTIHAAHVDRLTCNSSWVSRSSGAYYAEKGYAKGFHSIVRAWLDLSIIIYVLGNISFVDLYMQCSVNNFIILIIIFIFKLAAVNL